MFNPSNLMTETDKLNGLIEILKDPDKYQKQIAELNRLSQEADKRFDRVAEETIAYQNLRNEVVTLVDESDKRVKELTLIMERATKAVQEASDYRADANSKAIEVVREARTLLAGMQRATEEAIGLLKQKINEQEDRVVLLDREIIAKEAKEAEIQKRIEALRESLSLGAI